MQCVLHPVACAASCSNPLHLCSVLCSAAPDAAQHRHCMALHCTAVQQRTNLKPIVQCCAVCRGLCRCGRAPDDISSIVLVEEGGHYIKSDAVLRIASRLGLPLPLVAAALMPLPHFIRDTFYDQVRPRAC